METANKVRNATYPKDWAISLDLTDAYLHVPIHVTSRKYLRFCLKGRVFQFRALPFGLATSPFVFTRLMVAIATHLRVRAIILFPYLDDWLVRNQCRLELIKDNQIDYFTGSNNQSREIGTKSIPKFHIHRDGICNSRQYCQSSLGQSTSYSMPSILVSEASCCHSKNVSLITGETECVCSICGIRQATSLPSPDGTFRTVETACTSTGAQNIYHRTDKTSSGIVVGQGQIYARSCSQTVASSAHSLHRCELFGMGCSFGTGRTHVSWSLATEPISTSHQHSRNEGFSFSPQRVSAHSVQFLSNDSDRQFFGRGLSPEGERYPLTNIMHGGMGDLRLVSREWNISQCQTHSRENQYFGRPTVTVGQTNINRMVLESVNMQLELPDDGTTQHRSFCDTANNRLPLYVSPITDSKALAIDAMSMNWDGIHAYAFSPFHIIPAILTKIRMHRCKIGLIAPLWPQRPWFLELLHLSIAAPIFLPVIRGFLTQRTGTGNSVQVDQNPQTLSLLAWTLSSDQLQIETFRKTLWNTFLKQKYLPHERYTRQNGAYLPVRFVQEKLLLARQLLQM